MNLSSLPLTVASAFVVTLATVIVPNPSTIAASRLVVTRGARAAAAFLSAVVVLDVAVFFVMALGLQPLLYSIGGTSYLVPIAGAGMVIVGAVMMVTAPRAAAKLRARQQGSAEGRGNGGLHGPFLAGLLVPAANPGFWVWWTTVGTSFIHAARQWGRLGLALLLASFLAGVSAWYIPLVLALRRGKDVFSPRILRWVLFAFGAALIAIGAHLLWKVLQGAP